VSVVMMRQAHGLKEGGSEGKRGIFCARAMLGMDAGFTQVEAAEH